MMPMVVQVGSTVSVPLSSRCSAQAAAAGTVHSSAVSSTAASAAAHRVLWFGNAHPLLYITTDRRNILWKTPELHFHI